MNALNSLKDQLVLKVNNLKILVTNKITQVKSMKNDGAFDRISETTVFSRHEGCIICNNAPQTSQESV